MTETVPVPMGRRVRAVGPRVRLLDRTLAVSDGLFFLLGASAAAWLAWVTVREVFTGGFGDWWLLLLLWPLLAYLLLPRLHTALALVYVPDYFIGRTRTYEGLLGDPVNVALQGSEPQVHRAMVRAGWHLADELGFRSGLRIVTSTLLRRTYPNAPVSPLFLFQRVQDFTYQQEVDGNPLRRHHVRFWRTPEGWFLPGGRRVDWLAAGTYDSGVGLSAFTLQITHRIASDTDAERDHIVATVTGATPAAEVEVIKHFSSGYHSRNGGGDAIRTDGDLPVLDLGALSGSGTGATVVGRRSRSAIPQNPRELLDKVGDTGASNRIKRPMTLYLAYGLMLLRAVVGVATAAAAVLGLPGAGSPFPAVPAGQTPLALAGVVAVAVLYVVVGQRTFGGHPLARTVALTASVVAIAVALLADPTASATTAPVVRILDLVLDIGILITLSSGDVRDFAVRMTARRETLRAVRREARDPAG